MEKKFFDQRYYLDQLGLSISKDNFNESKKILKELCIFSPFNTQNFVQVFINAWCVKILNMIENKLYDNAGTRIRSLFILVKHNISFNKLVVIYFAKVNEKSSYSNLDNYEKVIFFSMQSQYFYQIGKHNDAENSVFQCFKYIKKIYKKNSEYSDIFFLIQKCLKSVKNKKKGEDLLNSILKFIN